MKKQPDKPAEKKTRLTVPAVETQLRQAFGNLAAVARAFGVARTSVLGFVNRHPSLVTVMKECRESMKDNAESALYNAVLRGEAWATCFYLKTQAKDRGYIERQEIVSDDRVQLQITEEIVDAPAGPKDDPPAPGTGGIPAE